MRYLACSWKCKSQEKKGDAPLRADNQAIAGTKELDDITKGNKLRRCARKNYGEYQYTRAGRERRMNGTLRTDRKTGGGPGECVTWAPERDSAKEQAERQAIQPGDTEPGKRQSLWGCKPEIKRSQ